MDALKAQLLRIQDQLGNLSASQKMLTASLVVIMVMTIGWWARYAGTAEMEPVLDQALSANDIGQIKARLDARGITARIVGDRVLVPSDRKFEAMADLAYNNSLPSNTSTAWDTMTKQMSLWDSSSKSAEIYLQMKQRVLSEMITAHFPGVVKADVLINAVSERRIGNPILPGASVMITTRGQEQNVRKLVTAAAATIASAVPGLARSRVTVVVDGITRPTVDADPDMGGDQFEQKRELERDKAETLRMMLPPNSLVAVSVELDMTRRRDQQVKYDPKDSIIKDTVNESQTTESVQPQQSASEPGVASNVGIAIQSGPAANNATNTSEKTRQETTILAGQTTSTIETPAGNKPQVVSAAIGIPRSYFVKILKGDGPDAKEPDDKAIQALATTELEKFKTRAQNAIGMKAAEAAEAISVDMYYDTNGPMLASVSQASAAGGLGAMVGGHAREMALGALAIISLFMVSMIVKKGTPSMPIPVPVAPKETPRLDAGEDIAGIVGDGDAMLDGMELDENAVKAQQMVEQVSTMVKENPDAAANLVKRWLNHS